jgi:putative transposase
MYHTKSRSTTKTNTKINTASTDCTPQELQELLWAEIQVKIKSYVQSLVENILEVELATHLQAAKYQRAEGRKGYRNGSYSRSLGTWYGTIDDLSVPRLREGSCEYQMFDRYARRAGTIDQAIGTLFLNGVSTRKLYRITKELIGTPVSSSVVSTIAADLSDQDLKQFQTGDIADEFRFMYLDGIFSKIKEIGVEGKVMLCCVGVTHQGERRIINARLSDSESTASWQAFLMDMKTRGLKGKALELAIIDGCPGLIAALKTVYPYVKRQRCIAHKMRNVAVKIRRAHQKECLKGAKLIFAAPSRTEAIRRFKDWKNRWEDYEERAVRCLEDDLNECLTYYQFDKELWKKIRTTNIIERMFREFRRRTRPMSIALPPESTERLFAGLSKGLNENWRQRPLEFTHRS